VPCILQGSVATHLMMIRSLIMSILQMVLQVSSWIFFWKLSIIWHNYKKETVALFSVTVVNGQFFVSPCRSCSHVIYATLHWWGELHCMSHV